MLLKNFNVLVVDDVILMCDFLFGVAAKVADCRVFKAVDGKSAAEILESEAIDLLITDLEMRSPTGLELVSRVRCGQFTATAHDIPVMIFSGNTYLQLIQQCISLDINDFLAKPITSAHLTKKIHHHLKTEKAISSAAHYQAISAGLSNNTPVIKEAEQKLRVSIVRELPRKADNHSEDTNETATRSRDKDFLFWPENATTGYFQLDRRLRNLAFSVSCFHNVFVNNCKSIAIESERKRACDAIDYLLHISKNIKRMEQRREFWQLFNIRIEKLKPIAAELARINIKHHQGVLTLLKTLSYWWMQTCNRPIIQRSEHDEVDTRLHG